MPTSRNRKKHAHHQHHPRPHTNTGAAAAHATAKHPRKRSAITIMMIFLAVIGTGVAFLAGGSNGTLLLGGALLGAIAGYFIGQGMDKAVAKTNK